MASSEYNIHPSSALAAVLAMTGWGLVHIFIILAYRSALINTGRAKPNGFVPSRSDSSSTFIGRVGNSHANISENLPLFAIVVFCHQFSGASSDISGMAWNYVYARVGQSLAHWAGTSSMAVTSRFLFFIASLFFLGKMAYVTVFV